MRYHYNKVHDLNTLHEELQAAGLTPQHVEGRDDDIWITVESSDEAAVTTVVEAHDGATSLSSTHWRMVRNKRNRLLGECDWTCITDTQLSEADQTSWQTYRQALRDVPQNENDPENITWPSAPSD